MGGGTPRKEYLEKKKVREIQEGTQKTLPRVCDSCGHTELHHGTLTTPKGKANPKARVRCDVKHCKCQGFVKQGTGEKND